MLGNTVTDDPRDKVRAAFYAELCTSYHHIDDFRSKLLALLPIASAGGLFLLLDDTLADKGKILAARGVLVPVGIFGATVAAALLCYEIYGIRKCGALIATGKRLEEALGVEGQFTTRPPDFINEPFAAGVVYPAVIAAWAFLAMFADGVANAAQFAGALFVAGFAAMAIWNGILVRGPAGGTNKP